MWDDHNHQLGILSTNHEQLCITTPKTPRFSFSKCPFCIKAKKELNDMGVAFTALDLDQMDQEVNP